LNGAEQHLKYLPSGLDNEAEICEAIEQHQYFRAELQDQQVLVRQALDIVEEILKACVPEAMINVIHCLAVL
jgi:hypothetical protein